MKIAYSDPHHSCAPAPGADTHPPRDHGLSDGVSGTDPGSTASSLIRGVKALDPAAWRRLAAVYGPLVYRWAHGPACAAMTRPTSLRKCSAPWSPSPDPPARPAWRHLPRLALDHHPQQSPRLLRAAGPTTLRRPAGRPRELLLLVADDDSGSSSSAPAQDGPLRRAVELVRAEFEQRSWLAFWRVTVEGRPAAAVAAELGLTTNAVYLARSRVLRRLREVLSGDELGSGDGSSGGPGRA